jgi:hypothetical protein
MVVLITLETNVLDVKDKDQLARLPRRASSRGG